MGLHAQEGSAMACPMHACMHARNQIILHLASNVKVSFETHHQVAGIGGHNIN